jgi:hypothetical protein
MRSIFLRSQLWLGTHHGLSQCALHGFTAAHDLAPKEAAGGRLRIWSREILRPGERSENRHRCSRILVEPSRAGAQHGIRLVRNVNKSAVGGHHPVRLAGREALSSLDPTAASVFAAVRTDERSKRPRAASPSTPRALTHTWLLRDDQHAEALYRIGWDGCPSGWCSRRSRRTTLLFGVLAGLALRVALVPLEDVVARSGAQVKLGSMKLNELPDETKESLPRKGLKGVTRCLTQLKA